MFQSHAEQGIVSVMALIIFITLIRIARLKSVNKYLSTQVKEYKSYIYSNGRK